MSKITAKIKEEIKALIPPVVFFAVALLIVGMVRALFLRGTGVAPSAPLTILLAALVLGKAVLLGDLWSAIDRYPHKPLIYNILWKTLVYSLVATLLHYLERLIDFWREAGSFMGANRLLLARIVWAHFWAIEIVIVILVLNYCVITEFARVLGADKLRQMFIGSSSNTRS